MDRPWGGKELDTTEQPTLSLSFHVMRVHLRFDITLYYKLIN